MKQYVQFFKTLHNEIKIYILLFIFNIIFSN